MGPDPFTNMFEKMRLGLRRGSERRTKPIVSGQAPEQPSLALKGLLRGLERSSRPHVLDLGRVAGANLTFFARFEAKVSIADLYRSLAPARPTFASGAEPSSHVFDKFLPIDPASPFDAVLVWDLLNYLKPEEIGWLGTSLSRFCKPGARILAFIATSREIALLPARYTIRDEGTLSCEPEDERKRPAPRYSEQTLLRLMPGTTVESRFQLRNETIEYLFSQRVVSGL
jgi:hypothetical protein